MIQTITVGRASYIACMGVMRNAYSGMGRDVIMNLSSIQSGELLEYINDIAYDGLPSLELFIYVLIYLVI